MSPSKKPLFPLVLQGQMSHLSQQDLQSPPEGSILPAQLLVVCQHRLQPSFQTLQVLFLLPPGLASGLPVLDHSLLPLQQLCLRHTEDQKGNERWAEEGNHYPKLTGTTLLPS